MKPANSQQAAEQTRYLLIRSLPGSRKSTVRAHLNRAERIGVAIYRRFNVGPYQAQAKHYRWYLEAQTRDLKPSTRYRYWLTVNAIVSALGKIDAWFAYLQGSWMRPGGGFVDLERGRPVKRFSS